MDMSSMWNDLWSAAVASRSPYWDDEWDRGHLVTRSADSRYARNRVHRNPFVYQLGHGPDMAIGECDDDGLSTEGHLIYAASILSDGGTLRQRQERGIDWVLSEWPS